MGYSSFMPVLETECIVSASSTTCTYTQVAPFETYDPGIVMGLAFLTLILVATFVRNVFYR